jgi:hypothetical protein
MHLARHFFILQVNNTFPYQFPLVYGSQKKGVQQIFRSNREVGKRRKRTSMTLRYLLFAHQGASA